MIIKIPITNNTIEINNINDIPISTIITIERIIIAIVKRNEGTLSVLFLVSVLRFRRPLRIPAAPTTTNTAKIT